MDDPLATSMGTSRFRKTEIGPNVMLKIPANAVMVPQWLITGDNHFEPSRYKSSWRWPFPRCSSFQLPLGTPLPFGLTGLVKGVIESPPFDVHPEGAPFGKLAPICPPFDSKDGREFDNPDT